MCALALQPCVLPKDYRGVAMRDYNYALNLKDNENEHIIKFDDYVDNINGTNTFRDGSYRHENEHNVNNNVDKLSNNIENTISPGVTEVVLPHLVQEQSNTNYDYVNHHDLRIIEVLFEDIAKNLFTYFLIIVFTTLCLYKIHQVQETRDITSRFNQVITDNDNLHKKWLSLLAQRQELSEHAKIRQAAVQKLNMVAPKTDSELVINLYNVK